MQIKFFSSFLIFKHFWIEKYGGEGVKFAVAEDVFNFILNWTAFSLILSQKKNASLKVIYSPDWNLLK